MQLDSYLEIFTTMYGWAFANLLGEAFAGTGLVVLPFGIMAFNAWRDAKEQGAEQIGVFGLVDRIGTQLIVGLFVFTTCFATSPLTSLHSINLRYKPLPTALEPNPAEVSRDGGTGSTFDNAMVDAINGSMSNASGSLSNVPAWWMTVMAISSGINNAVKSGLANSTSELRAIEELARIATIDDPRLLHNVQRFYSECFVPAKSKFIQMNPADLSAGGRAIIAPTNKDYGPADTGWIGSQLFRTEPGFYADMRSINPVTGFAIDFSRDADYYNPASGEPLPFEGFQNPEWGQPTCKEWWEDPSTGLREAMINHHTTWQGLVQHVLNLGKTQDQAKDEVARLAETKANPMFVDPTQAMGNAADVGLVRGVGATISSVGVYAAQIGSFVTIVPLMNGLLMMQAIILMGIYTFLPLVTFFSGYNLKIMFYGAVGIFTVKFWAVLWTITLWLDAHLIDAMYPKGVFRLDHFLTSITNDYKSTLLAVLMMTMFIGLPLLWTGMMGWVGVRVGREISSMAESTGRKADDITSKSKG